MYARKDEYEDPGLLRCDAVSLGHFVHRFEGT
jgi:hypothetical protein